MRDEKAGWEPAVRPLEFEYGVLRGIFERAVPGYTLSQAVPLSGGLSNTLYRLCANGLNDSFTLRFYTREPAACRKEIELHRMLRGAVPVPEIVYADPNAPVPYAVMRWVEGVTFREVKHSGDATAIAECARSIGKTLACIGTFTLDSPPLAGSDFLLRFAEECLAASCTARRLPPESQDLLQRYMHERAPRLGDFEGDRALVHSDFGAPNLVVDRISGRWQVTAVLDWEYAFPGSPLCDVGHMMRYERRQSPRIEPHFSEGYRDAGGVLPDDWFEVARTMDLTALLEFLARPSLPESIVPEIVGLVTATVAGH